MSRVSPSLKNLSDRSRNAQYPALWEEPKQGRPIDKKKSQELRISFLVRLSRVLSMGWEHVWQSAGSGSKLAKPPSAIVSLRPWPWCRIVVRDQEDVNHQPAQADRIVVTHGGVISNADDAVQITADGITIRASLLRNRKRLRGSLSWVPTSSDLEKMKSLFRKRLFIAEIAVKLWRR